MKYLIEEKDLIRLIKCEETLTALEKGKVHNWEWYTESLLSHEKHIGKGISDIHIKDYSYEEYKLSDTLYIKGKYNTNEELYYIDSPCVFEGYVNSNTCVVSLSLEIDYDEVYDEFKGTCMKCSVGGGYNTPVMTCSCDKTLSDLEILTEFINENQYKRYIICKETQLNKIPVTQKRNEEALKKHRHLVYLEKESYKDLKKRQIDITKEIEILNAELKSKKEKLDLDNE